MSTDTKAAPEPSAAALALAATLLREVAIAGYCSPEESMHVRGVADWLAARALG